MPRKPRLFVSGATYHVYSRVARGESAFDDPREAAEFVETARLVGELDGWHVLAWCLMGNHYHLVVATSTVPLWRSMARLQGRVARGFNRRRQYLGRLWQSRYRARVVDSQDYFRQVVAYVHLNPVSAGFVKDPADYRFSGHREILGLDGPGMVDLAAVLGGFGGTPWQQSKANYLAWLRAVEEARWFADGVESLPWWAASNQDDVADPRRHREAKTFEGQALEDDRVQLELDELAPRFERLCNQSLAELASNRRSRDLVFGRIELTALAVGRYGLRSCQVAKLIDKNASSVARWLQLGLRLEKEDPSFRRRLDFLDRAISSRPENATMGYVAPQVLPHPSPSRNLYPTPGSVSR